MTDTEKLTIHRQYNMIAALSIQSVLNMACSGVISCVQVLNVSNVPRRISPQETVTVLGSGVVNTKSVAFSIFIFQTLLCT